MHTRSALTLALFVFSTAACGFLPAEADEASEREAVKAADAWLAIVDQGNYEESWNQAASFFREAVPSDTWSQQIKAARAPMGQLISREVKSTTYAESLPGAPDGKYVVIQYKASFENKKSAIETITPMMDKDGSWRVSGYFIK